MSIPVAVTELHDALADRAYAYLVTVGTDGRPHAVAVTPRLVDGVLRAGVGHRSAANAGERPSSLTLVFPPAEVGGYTLIVDGTATLDGESISVTPAKAVLHRPAPVDAGPAEAGACGSDCVPVSLTPAS